MNDTKKIKRDNQGLGEFCGSSYLEECSRNFGMALERVCATCPD